MSRALFAWELGGNLGHITSLLIVARALRERGHEVVFAVRDARAVSGMLDKEGFRCLQAPSLPISSGSDLPQIPASYPEMLLHYGFSDANALRTQILAWRALFAAVTPDVLVMNYAPTALLASRGVGLPRVLLGTGFASPPRVSPMPSIRPWEHVPAERLVANERCALDSANAALKCVDEPPMHSLYELFSVDEDILATLPELDHYPARDKVRYSGPLCDAGGLTPAWSESKDKRVFVYLRPGSPAFKPLYDTLRRERVRALWFAPGLTDQLATELGTSSIRFSTAPLDMAKVVALTDAAIVPGGHGTTAAMLLGGVPILLIPENIEQLLLAQRVATLRAGKIVLPPDVGPGLTQIVAEFLFRQDYAARATRIERKYKTVNQETCKGKMVDSIENRMTVRVLPHTHAHIEPVLAEGSS